MKGHLRFDRQRFAAFGLPTLLNTLLLPGYALFTGPARDDVGLVFYLALAVLSLGIAAACIVKRGRDLGWSPVLTVAGGVLSLLLMPGVFFGLLALMLGRSHPTVAGYGPPPAPPTGARWLGAGVLLLGPWLVLHVARLLS